MKTKLLLPIVLTFILCNQADCQESGYEYFITANGNLYLPINNPNKGVYPILWYDKTTDPKVLVGGMGIGFTVLKSIKNKLTLKGQANISKQRYWDENINLRTISNEPIGNSSSVTSDYALGLAGLVHYSLSKRISIGMGLGTQFLFLSRSRILYISNSDGDLKYINRYYKPIMPVIPLELSLKLKKVLFNIRYEYGLLNRLRGDLAKEQKDKYSLLTFEFGFRIK